MPQKIAVAIVHGVGKQDAGFADGMSEKLKESFADQTGIGEDKVDEALAIQPVFWAPALQEKEDLLWKKLAKGGPLDFMSLRHFIVDFAADAIAYQQLPGKKGRAIYDAIHAIFAGALRKLAAAAQAGPEAPLCVIAHSLGTVISSNYIYDLQEEAAKTKPELIGSAVWNKIGETPLECGETLTLFYTLGSPLAIWSLRYENPDFGLPVEVPSPRLRKHYPAAQYPKLEGEWVNFYDEDDVLGYPLKQLNEEYRKAVKKDLPINAGGIFSSWNPLSHMAYWTDKDVVRPIAAGLVRTWRAVNP